MDKQATRRPLWHMVAGLLLAALPLVLCSCLFPRNQPKPAFRGLSGKEAAELDTMNQPLLPNKKMEPGKEATPEELIAEGDMFLQTRQFEGALLNYARILAKEPQRHDIRYKLGVALMLSGKLAEAKKELALVLAQKEMLEAHEALGLIFLQEGNVTEAERELRAVLALEPQRVRAQYLLGVTYLKAERPKDAVTVLSQALNREPGNVKVLSSLGMAHLKMKNYEEAIQYFKKARAGAPDDPKINHNLGLTYAAQKRYPEALEAFLKAGDEAQAYNNLGVHYFLDGRYADAAKCFQRALELRPTFYEEARRNLDRALKKMQEEGQGAGEG